MSELSLVTVVERYVNPASGAYQRLLDGASREPKVRQLVEMCLEARQGNREVLISAGKADSPPDHVMVHQADPPTGVHPDRFSSVMRHLLARYLWGRKPH